MGRPCVCCRKEGCPYCSFSDVNIPSVPAPLAEAKVGVSGLLIGSAVCPSWFDTPFPTVPYSQSSGQNRPSCDQAYFGFGSFDKPQLDLVLSGPRGCSFDGIVVKEGVFVCFFREREGNRTPEDLTAIAVGPVIINHDIWKPRAPQACPSSFPAPDPYTMHWAQVGFLNAAKSIKVCPYRGRTGDADIMFLPDRNPLP